MRKVVMYMQISLDGIVSNVEDWMTYSEEMLEDVVEYYNEVDTILVGSNTYASLAEYWQNAEQSSVSMLERSISKKINEMKKVVISRSNISLIWNNSQQLMIDDINSLVREVDKLKKFEGKNISVESGVKTWQIFLQNSLFDELRLFVHPVVTIYGDKLFADVEKQYSLRLINNKTYKNGVVGLHYQKD